MREKIYEAVRWLALLGIILLIVLMSLQTKTSSAPFESVEEAVLSGLDLSQMQQADNQMLKRLYGLQPSEFEDCTLYYPTTNMGAEELLLIKLTDKSQQQSVREAIEKRLETQKNSFDGYGIEQYDLLTNHAVVEVQGNYILFVVSEQAEAVRQAFLNAL